MGYMDHEVLLAQFEPHRSVWEMLPDAHCSSSWNHDPHAWHKPTGLIAVEGTSHLAGTDSPCVSVQWTYTWHRCPGHKET